MIRASKEMAGGAMSPCLSTVLSGPILAGKENTMAIIENQRAVEMPWRPGYRRFTLAGPEQGVTCSASLSVIEPVVARRGIRFGDPLADHVCAVERRRIGNRR